MGDTFCKLIIRMDKKLVSETADGGVACQYVLCLAVLLGSGRDFEGRRTLPRAFTWNY